MVVVGRDGPALGNEFCQADFPRPCRRLCLLFCSCRCCCSRTSISVLVVVGVAVAAAAIVAKSRAKVAMFDIMAHLDVGVIISARLLGESIVPNEPCTLDWHDRTKRRELEACVLHNNRIKSDCQGSQSSQCETMYVPAFVLYLFVLGPADLVRSASPFCVGDSAWEGMQRLILLASSGSSAQAARPPATPPASGAPWHGRSSVGCSEVRRPVRIQMVGVNSALPPPKSSLVPGISCR